VRGKEAGGTSSGLRNQSRDRPRILRPTMRQAL
jgi:hypothetical protein